MPGPTPRDWLLNLTMLQEFVRRPSVLFVFWTLKLELVLYAVFSLLYALGLQRRSGGLVAVLLAVFAVSAAARTFAGQTCGIGGMNFLYFAPLMGLLAYRHLEGRTSRGPLLALGFGQAGLLLTACLVDRATGRAAPEDGLNCLVTACIWGLAYGSFFLALANRQRRMPALLCWVGRISYSVYLFHILVLSLLAPLRLPGWGTFRCCSRSLWRSRN